MAMSALARLLFLIAALLSLVQPALAVGGLDHGMHDQGAAEAAMASHGDSGAMADCPATGAPHGDHAGNDHGSCPQQACGACLSVLTILPLPLMTFVPLRIPRETTRPDHFPHSPYLAAPYKPPRHNA